METRDANNSPNPPRVLNTILAGFDAITNHIFLILIPLGLDLLIWFAPRLRLKNLIESWMIGVFRPIGDAPDVAEMMESAKEIWTLMAEHFNLLITIRSYPVGIPSLMVSILPMQTPKGDPLLVEIEAISTAIVLVLGLTLLGLVGGALYFSLVARAAIHDEVRLRNSLSQWPRASLNVILLAFVWLGLLMAVSVPVSCGLSLMALSGISLGPIAIFVFGSLFVWLAFPLLFSPHGIFANHESVLNSIKNSIRITRMTLPATATFFLSAVLLGQGLDFVWRIPSETSWLMLIGIAGHAFVSTGLLSASFIYYRKADVWVQSVMEQVAQHTTSTESAT